MFFHAYVEVDLTDSVTDNLECIVQRFYDAEWSKDESPIGNKFVRFYKNLSGSDIEALTYAIDVEVKQIYTRCGAEGHFHINVSN